MKIQLFNMSQASSSAVRALGVAFFTLISPKSIKELSATFVFIDWLLGADVGVVLPLVPQTHSLESSP